MQTVGFSIGNQASSFYCALGYEDFKEITNENCYFVDKTLMIKELLEGGAKDSLFTRPRRFGKTLNQNMIQSNPMCDRVALNLFI